MNSNQRSDAGSYGTQPGRLQGGTCPYERHEGDAGYQSERDAQGYSGPQHQAHYAAPDHQQGAEPAGILDDDHHAIRQERYRKFSDEFSQWRSEQALRGGSASQGVSSTGLKDGINAGVSAGIEARLGAGSTGSLSLSSKTK
ncbi:hypothetical protein SAMN05216359_10698 [Roseateles sp. YR242]|uniref:hypothetical protein n=1 Tax=Roseateles sp. YR242 TaxID=1855305 RepID=UPI0008BD1889|nr:hypothetical protein [Roseateles sp. YR242]SEL19496.1 hypothetical protein SAMN05216359_10698 [Roseateles sp. YR242]